MDPQQLLTTVKISDGIYVGDENSAEDLDMILLNHVTHIVNLCPKNIPTPLQKIGIKYLSINWQEQPQNSIKIDIDLLVSFFEETHSQGQSILICCTQSHSRTFTLLAIYFITKFGWSLYKTLQFLNTRIPIVVIHESYSTLLKQYEQQLLNANRIHSYNWEAIPSNYQQLVLRNTIINARSSQNKVKQQFQYLLKIDAKRQNKMIANNPKNKKSKRVQWEDLMTNRRCQEQIVSYEKKRKIPPTPPIRSLKLMNNKSSSSNQINTSCSPKKKPMFTEQKKQAIVVSVMDIINQRKNSSRSKFDRNDSSKNSSRNTSMNNEFEKQDAKKIMTLLKKQKDLYGTDQNNINILKNIITNRNKNSKSQHQQPVNTYTYQNSLTEEPKIEQNQKNNQTTPISSKEANLFKKYQTQNCNLKDQRKIIKLKGSSNQLRKNASLDKQKLNSSKDQIKEKSKTKNKNSLEKISMTERMLTQQYEKKNSSAEKVQSYPSFESLFNKQQSQTLNNSHNKLKNKSQKSLHKKQTLRILDTSTEITHRQKQNKLNNTSLNKSGMNSTAMLKTNSRKASPWKPKQGILSVVNLRKKWR